MDYSIRLNKPERSARDNEEAQPYRWQEQGYKKEGTSKKMKDK
jgi:hypothetical protein